jgi:hypothetical protein
MEITIEQAIKYYKVKIEFLQETLEDGTYTKAVEKKAVVKETARLTGIVDTLQEILNQDTDIVEFLEENR